MPREMASGYRTLCDTALGRVWLLTSARNPLLPGQQFVSVGQLMPPREGQVEQAAHLGIVGSLQPQSLQVANQPARLWQVGLAIRRSFDGFVHAYLSPNSAALADSLCFNNDSELPPDLMSALQRSGTVHIISASGLHVALLAGMVAWLTLRMPIPRWAAFVVLLVVLMTYAAAAGFNSPIQRAALMSLAFMGAQFVRREADLISALCFSALVILLFDPLSLFDVGFQLSFVAFAGLALYGGWQSAASRAWVLSRVLRWNVVAAAVTAPLVAYYFGFVSLVGVVANLLIGPAVALLTGLSLVWWLLAPLVPTPLSAMASLAAEGLAGFIAGVAKFASGFSFAVLELPPFEAYWLLPVYILAIASWRQDRRSA